MKSFFNPTGIWKWASEMKVDTFHFHFNSNVSSQRYDETAFYREVLTPQGLKAVDIVAAKTQQGPPVCWLIEAKDFRTIRGIPGQKNEASNLPATVESKARDTIKGLGEMATAADSKEDRAHAARALRAKSKRVVLHMEVAEVKSKLFQNQPDPAKIKQKLRQLLRDVDPNPLILSIKTTPRANVPWSVS